MFEVERYHDISCGHRVAGHESKCRHLHGHNYRIHFVCVSSGLDAVGRVIDFSALKARLCMWLEDNWDHKFLMWQEDPLAANFQAIARMLEPGEPCHLDHCVQSFVYVPFNPTAENMARYLVEVVGPQALADTGIELIRCRVEETRKCTATYAKD